MNCQGYNSPMKNLLICCLIFSSFHTFASDKPLDKIVAIFNKEVITLSMVTRIQSNINARRTIAPQFYPTDKMTQKEVIDQIIHTRLIKEKLFEMGYNITDDQVEDQVKSTEQRLGINRKELLAYLKNNNLSFNEYFELIRSSIEFSIFHSRVITPLISISEQQIKNTFYRMNADKRTLSFKYDLVLFIVPAADVGDKSPLLKDWVKEYRQTGIQASAIKHLQVTELGEVSEEGLAKNIMTSLKKTDEGDISSPILNGDSYNLFFVRKKNLVESSIFLDEKEKIRNKIFAETSQDMMEIWFKREANNHFIKIL